MGDSICHPLRFKILNLKSNRAGEYDDDGATSYNFSCFIEYTQYDPEEKDKNYTSDDLLEQLSGKKQLRLPGTPKAILSCVEIDFDIFGRTLYTHMLFGRVQVEDWTVMLLRHSTVYSDDNPANVTEVFLNFYEVLKAIRINGKKLRVENITPSEIEEVLRPTSNVNREFSTEFKVVDPDESLYPHYASIKRVLNIFPGAIVNQWGTEFEFEKFSSMLDTWSTDTEFMESKPLLQKIYDLNPAGYTLGETAKCMMKLFRVDKDVFVAEDDREAELSRGLMRKAYMMSALRSFAWTLAHYCKEHNETPDTIDNSVPSQIANFVASRDWLNYDGNTYCKGLCSGSDLHVYFLPDKITAADKKRFLPSQEDFERVRKMKKTQPSYNEILCEVHSLEALRKDLEYIYPAIEILYDDLVEDRDTSTPLEGNESEIVYAWIALATAAEGPFFSKDGPMGYSFDWPGEYDDDYYYDDEWEY